MPLAMLVEKNKFLFLFLFTTSLSPGSYIGKFIKSESFHAAILFSSISTRVTSMSGQ